MWRGIRFFSSRVWRDNRGAVMITMAVMTVTLIGFAALAVDFGLYMQERQRMQDALDAGALAGAHLLPRNLPDATGKQAREVALDYATSNDLELARSAITIRFGCFVRRDPENLGAPLLTDVRASCQQFFPDGLGSFECGASGRCYRECDIDEEGAKCNTISLTATRDIPLLLAPAIGALKQLSASLQGSACSGVCAPQNLGVMFILDRTSSMGSDLSIAKEAITTVLADTSFIPEFHRVGLAILPPESNDPNDPYVLEKLTNNYQGVSDRVDALTLGLATTNLKAPLDEVAKMFDNDAQSADVVQAALLLTDGAPNQPSDPNNPLIGERPCEQALEAANQFKGAGIRLFTIGYGLTGRKCIDRGTLNNRPADELLAEMASGSPAANAACDLENTDGDDFFCEARGAELTQIIETIISELVSAGAGSRLVDLTVSRQ